ncbi:polyphosphate polymerase domain-containing protein [Marinomonas ostreistagni]|uniref:Polyphosphate polymerase domain-containing protein n=1 Tax=Marinomonas ostreistagni TaxID=359209 RepID=A0ABS0ZBF0_9GAMM|nr:polyphosphate polymerase domain-containing protein [Marinomonas ostreistagni]MBJ7551004.1 polyphosphate polymerase domain-containing protein [Marinomonas ostreistagni]MEC8080507.1 polyphosphate polymerase domain-containing protein [Pseudomonadota bacterium]RUM56872.1 MAG: VTC domain-containing protein [Marinomonas sp.]
MSKTLKVQRHEVKYYISYADYEYARHLLATLMQRDPHQKDERGYFIRSLYFDDDYDTSVEEKLDGIEHRDKYRLRTYDPTLDWVKLERKRKHNQFVNKSSVRLSKAEALQMIDGDVDFLLEKDSQSARSIYFDLKRKFIRPKVIVDYDREVYMLDYNEIRVTFDKNIRVNTSDLDLFNPDLETQTLQRPDTIIMEVKFNTCLPSWFPTLLKFDGTTAMAISKYCQGRMHMREFYGD